MSNRKYPQEFVEEAVKLAQESGKPVMVIARELGVNHHTLRKWIKIATKDEAEEIPTASGDKRRIKELENKVRRLEMEREILKKATAYFAKEHL